MNVARITVICLALGLSIKLLALPSPHVDPEEDGVFTIVFGDYSYVATVGAYLGSEFVEGDHASLYEICLVFNDEYGSIDLGCAYDLAWFDSPQGNGQGEASTLGMLMDLPPTGSLDGDINIDDDLKPRIVDGGEGVIWSYMPPAQ